MIAKLTSALLAAALVSAPAAFSEEKKDAAKALPKVVEPQYDGEPVPAPEGATVLFDGKDVTGWKQGKGDGEVKWKVGDGYMEVVRGTGFLRTKEPIKGSVHLHIEWATPAEVKGSGQGRGNSGVFIGGFPEVQVLDSYENETYPDGQAGALYKHSVPLVNASKKPGEWQCYDILIERPVIEDGKVVQKARLTVRHNNVLVQDKVEFGGNAIEGTLGLQDHGNPVRYRNIWYKPIGG
ncbi:MAG: DUF1080 domain-containing protein [Verrucomicrobiales bacterium]